MKRKEGDGKYREDKKKVQREQNKYERGNQKTQLRKLVRDLHDHSVLSNDLSRLQSESG